MLEFFSNRCDLPLIMAPKKIAPIFAAKQGPKKRKAAESDEPPAAKAAKGESSAEAPTTVSAVASGGLQAALVASIECPKWREALDKELAGPKFRQVCEKVEKDLKAGEKVFPPQNQIFAAFNHAKWDDLKVVIIGQDPYHDDGQAHGLCFSVNSGVAVPPSLKNMYTELEADIPGYKRPDHGNLEAWAKQGVLLLNASLTVIAHKANSHANIGWQNFTNGVIKVLNEKHNKLVFLLWGGFAQRKGKLIDKSKHRVLEAAHPSPLSVNKWRGCKTFSKCNAALKELGKEPVNWQN